VGESRGSLAEVDFHSESKQQIISGLLFFFNFFLLLGFLKPISNYAHPFVSGRCVHQKEIKNNIFCKFLKWRKKKKMCYRCSELSFSFLRFLTGPCLSIKSEIVTEVIIPTGSTDGISERSLFTASLEKNTDTNQTKFDLHDLCNSHKLRFV
jgi:hypothetical protein